MRSWQYRPRHGRSSFTSRSQRRRQGNTKEIRYVTWAVVLERGRGFEPFMAAYLVGRNFTMRDIVVLLVVRQLLSFLLSIPTGIFADCTSRVLSLTIGAAACAAGMVVYGVSSSWGGILAASVLAGAGKNFFAGADFALAKALYQKDCGSGWSTQLLNLCRNQGLGEAGCCLAATGLAASIGISAVLWAQALVYLAVFALVMRVREPQPADDTSTATVRPQPAASGQSTQSRSARQRWSIVALISAMGAMASLTAVTYRITPLAYEQIRTAGKAMPASGFGCVWTIYLAATWLFGLGSSWVARISLQKSLALLMGLTLVGGVSLAGFGLTSSLWGLTGIFGLALVRVFETPLAHRLLGELTAERRQAATLSVLRTVQDGTAALMLLFLNWVQVTRGLRDAFILVGSANAGLALAALGLFACLFRD